MCVCVCKVTHARELGYMPTCDTGNRFPVDSILTVRSHPTLRLHPLNRILPGDRGMSLFSSSLGEEGAGKGAGWGALLPRGQSSCY